MCVATASSPSVSGKRVKPDKPEIPDFPGKPDKPDFPDMYSLRTQRSAPPFHVALTLLTIFSLNHVIFLKTGLFFGEGGGTLLGVGCGMRILVSIRERITHESITD